MERLCTSQTMCALAGRSPPVRCQRTVFFVAVGLRPQHFLIACTFFVFGASGDFLLTLLWERLCTSSDVRSCMSESTRFFPNFKIYDIRCIRIPSDTFFLQRRPPGFYRILCRIPFGGRSPHVHFLPFVVLSMMVSHSSARPILLSHRFDEHLLLLGKLIVNTQQTTFLTVKFIISRTRVFLEIGGGF